jgi:hypothetical protein
MKEEMNQELLKQMESMKTSTKYTTLFNFAVEFTGNNKRRGIDIYFNSERASHTPTMLRLQPLFATVEENDEYEYDLREDEVGAGENKRIIKASHKGFPPHTTRKNTSEKIRRIMETKT